ncbi:hypothetical protein RHMOL_Rhmol04G0251500 [Rhododendron molle]|uniref:Uncharacterized protein n=1 Tax=Rhododendron molle TaxID=49168 RepID=A0ACC0P410_RHOML|nr:hypothetical protein RHMOL_Rhmol04G0251500 [Rhododendron molle]
MATSTAPKEENSTTTSNDASPAPRLSPPLTATTDSSPKEIDEPKSLGDSPTTGDATGDAAADPMAVKNNGANNDDVTVSDTQKKMRRAERLQNWIDCGKRLYSLSENDACSNVLLGKALQRRTVHTLVLKNPPSSFLPKPVYCCSKYNVSHGITTSELPCPTQNPRQIHWIIGNPIAL